MRSKRYRDARSDGVNGVNGSGIVKLEKEGGDGGKEDVGEMQCSGCRPEALRNNTQETQESAGKRRKTQKNAGRYCAFESTTSMQPPTLLRPLPSLSTHYNSLLSLLSSPSLPTCAQPALQHNSLPLTSTLSQRLMSLHPRIT